MPDYWGEVHERWAASIDAANAGRINNAAQLRQLRFRIPLPYVPIAITGVRGAGKSVVYDALVGRIGKDYFPGGRSTKVDDWRVKTGKSHKRRSGVVVIPGQIDSEQQEQAFNDMFRNGNKPKGVIHVVSWGYDWIWENRYRRAKVAYLQGTGKEVNLQTLRRENLCEELEYFNSICDLLKSSWAMRPPGVWLIIAVTKCDLFWPKMEAARRYYLPTKDSDTTTPFRSALSKLVANLHQGGLRRLAVLPVSSLLAPFNFSEATDFNFKSSILADPSLEDIQRQALVNSFQMAIGGFNAKR